MTPLGERTAKNSLYGFLSYVIPIAFTIVITPMIVHRLGVESYGLFVLTSVLAGFFGLFKFGLGYGVSKAVSEYHGDRTRGGVSEVISSTLVLYLAVGVAGFLVSVLLACYGLDWMNVSPERQFVAGPMFIFAGAAFFFGSINSTFTNAIAALQRLDVYTKIYLSGMFIQNIGILLLLLAGKSVVSLIAMQLFTNALLTVVYWIALRRLLPEISVRVRYNHAAFKPYLALNWFAYLHEAAITLLFELDKVLVAAFMGPVAVSYYSIAGTITQKIQGAVGSATSVAMPVASSLTAGDQAELIGPLYRRSLRLVIIIAGGMTVLAISLGPELLRYWLAVEFEQNALIPLYILAVTYFILSIFTTFGHFLLGLGHVKELSRYTAVLAGLNVILLVPLLPTLGIIGASLAYLGCLFPLFFMIKKAEGEYFKLTDSKSFYANHLGKFLIVAMICIGLGMTVGPLLIHNLVGVIIGGAILFVCYIGTYRILGFIAPSDLLVLKNLFKRLI